MSSKSLPREALLLDDAISVSQTVRRRYPRRLLFACKNPHALYLGSLELGTRIGTRPTATQASRRAKLALIERGDGSESSSVTGASARIVGAQAAVSQMHLAGRLPSSGVVSF